MKAAVVWISLSAAACGGGGGGGGVDASGPGGGGSISWKADGTKYSGSVVVDVTVMSGTVGVAAGDTSGAIGLGLQGTTAATYTIGDPAPTGIEFNDITAGTDWKAEGAIGSGMIVITAFDAHEIVGTFEGTLPGEHGVSGSKSITEGQFDLTY